MNPTTKAILAFIKRFLSQKGYSPSVREILQGLSLSSTSVVNYHLALLEKQGYIRRVKGQARTITLTKAGEG